MYFSAKFEKTQEKPKLFKKTEKKPKALRKNPRTQDWIGKPKILGENPRSGNAGMDSQMKVIASVSNASLLGCDVVDICLGTFRVSPPSLMRRIETLQ